VDSSPVTAFERILKKNKIRAYKSYACAGSAAHHVKVKSKEFENLDNGGITRHNNRFFCNMPSSMLSVRQGHSAVGSERSMQPVLGLPSVIATPTMNTLG